MDTTTQIVAWALGAATATGLVVRQAAAALWKGTADAQKELVETLKRQALSSETRAIASDQARAVAEKRAGELEMKYTYLKQRFQDAVEALDAAQVKVNPRALTSPLSLPPRSEEQPTGVWIVEGDKRVRFFLGEEAERRRQKPLNPSGARVDDLLQPYVDSDRPPKR